MTISLSCPLTLVIQFLERESALKERGESWVSLECKLWLWLLWWCWASSLSHTNKYLVPFDTSFSIYYVCMWNVDASSFMFMVQRFGCGIVGWRWGRSIKGRRRGGGRRTTLASGGGGRCTIVLIRDSVYVCLCWGMKL